MTNYFLSVGALTEEGRSAALGAAAEVLGVPIDPRGAFSLVGPLPDHVSDKVKTECLKLNVPVDIVEAAG